MNIFETIKDYEQLVFFTEKSVGLKGIICIHNTTIGPALGGCRLYNYKTEEDAIFDVTRLAKGMTYKSAITGLPWGGGKAVIIGDPKVIKSEYLFKAFGKYVESLNGRYITAEDVNTNVTDMGYISEVTNYVSGLDGASGNPSWYTAKGTYSGMKAAVKEKFKIESLKGIRVALQGLGSVAMLLAEMLYKEGAILTATDIDQAKCTLAKEKYNVHIVAPEDIFAVDCDVFSPAAMGAVITEETMGKLKAKVIAGCANNQLLTDSLAKGLEQLGIIYVPDYLLNAGGLISVTREFVDLSAEQALKIIENIYHTTTKIFALAKEHGITTVEAANMLAEKRISEAAKIDKIYTQRSKMLLKKCL